MHHDADCRLSLSWKHRFPSAVRTSQAETSLRPTKYTHFPSCGLPVCMPLGQRREGFGWGGGGLTPERSAARSDAHLHSGLQGGEKVRATTGPSAEAPTPVGLTERVAAARDRVFSPPLTFVAFPSGSRPRDREKR